LICNDDNVCEPGGTIPIGSPCVISPECEMGQCIAGLCAPGGEGGPGATCANDGECEVGLRCAVVGLGLQCVPQGSGDVGDTCSNSTDCFGGLACLGGTCAVPPPGTPPFGLPWQGVDCEPPDTSGARAFFEVPGAPDAQEGDFFRLPFPNDVRRGASGLDLTGFPTPGTGFGGIDPVKLYVDALTDGEEAWGAYPTVTFRFSGALDFDTFNQPTPAINWVDVTPNTPEYGGGAGAAWFYYTGRTAYVCDHWLAVRRLQGAPLTPGHTYAVWITTQGKAQGGGNIQRAENLAAVLGNVAPSNPALLAAHTAFKPFRDYLADQGTSANTILNATVITVGAVRDTMAELAQAVGDEAVPTASDWVKCGGGEPSPCPQAEGDRACGEANPDFDEYHALVSLPIFQEGTAPYLTAQDGGGISISATAPREDVCMALTVPKAGNASMPANGWPLVIFAHGTGGSFRSHVSSSVAGALARASVPFAVLGIDQVAHGPRRGTSTESPDNLFFNFLNPAAARGNPLQGAADQLGLARFAQALDAAAAETGGDRILIDPDNIFFFGHSQGATEGSLMLPYGDVFKAAVLSGNGASLKDSLRTKTRPVDIAAGLPIVLQDPMILAHTPENRQSFLDVHPVLSLLQHWIDPADPLNFAWPTTRAPISGHSAKHVFQTYGLGDTYSPPVTLATFALAGGLSLVENSALASPDPIGGLSAVAAPLAGNVTAGAASFTLGVRQYAPPSSRDGHFVVFDVPAANADMVRFFVSAVNGQVPQIGQ
jgi:predicted esterase